MRTRRISLVSCLLLGVLGGCADRSMGLSSDDSAGGTTSEEDDDEVPDDYDPGVRPGGRGAMYSVCADQSVCTPQEFLGFPRKNGHRGYAASAALWLA